LTPLSVLSTFRAVSEIAYIALGSNLGDRHAYLRRAREAIAVIPECRVVAASQVEETAPLGGLTQPPYLNQMLAVETSLEPETLLSRLHAIEEDAGRDRSGRWASRTLDLDIVRYGDRVVHSATLTIPHPGLAVRDFWQREMAELSAIMNVDDAR
jgi:2-amino-4-hydroxy-6-hydroxymethyldihydropteridine diphosphokinase